MNTFTKSMINASVAIMLVTPVALAQTTLGGNAKDNSASGGRTNGTTAGAGKGAMMQNKGMMKKNDMMKTEGMASDGMSKDGAMSGSKMDGGMSK